MKFYLAPMEGVTGYVYRNASCNVDSCMDKYFSPFIATNHNKIFTSREERDILPENNTSLKLVPQILGNCAADFTNTSRALQEYGYQEINLNLGCPSGTVVSKRKGAGMLAHTDELDRFLDAIYTDAASDGIRISIKTRIGMDSPDEFAALLDIYNKYPVSELIIHPRVRKDMYNNKPDWDMFGWALENSRAAVCYNGDIFTVEDYRCWQERFPDAGAVMLGRGLLMNPGLVRLIKGQKALDKQEWRMLHDDIYRQYRRIISGERNVLFKMKELWFYWSNSFCNCDAHYKRIRKAERCCDYENAVTAVFRDLQLR